MSKQQLLREAASIEASAKESLATWLILGQSSKFAAAMEQASKLRRAATLRTINERKEFMA